MEGGAAFYTARFPTAPNLALAPSFLSYLGPDGKTVQRIPTCVVTTGTTSIREGDVMLAVNGVPTINTHHHWLGQQQPHTVAVTLMGERRDQPKLVRFMRLAEPGTTQVLRFRSRDVYKELFDDPDTVPRALWDSPLLHNRVVNDSTAAVPAVSDGWRSNGASSTGAGGSSAGLNGLIHGMQHLDMSNGAAAMSSPGGASTYGNGALGNGFHGSSTSSSSSSSSLNGSSRTSNSSSSSNGAGGSPYFGGDTLAPAPADYADPWAAATTTNNQQQQHATATFFNVEFPPDSLSVGLNLECVLVEYVRATTGEMRAFDCPHVMSSTVSAEVRPGDLLVKVNGQVTVRGNEARSPSRDQQGLLNNVAGMVASAVRPKTLTFLRPRLVRPSVRFDTTPPTLSLTAADERRIFYSEPVPPSPQVGVTGLLPPPPGLTRNGGAAPSPGLAPASDFYVSPNGLLTSAAGARPPFSPLASAATQNGAHKGADSNGIAFSSGWSPSLTPQPRSAVDALLAGGTNGAGIGVGIGVSPTPLLSPAVRPEAMQVRGMHKDVIRSGDPSQRPIPGRPVTVHLTGYGRGGDLNAKFWSTRDPGQAPFTFNAGRGEVIRAWDEGVLTMTVGEVARVTCGPEYAYGADGFAAWGILPHSSLQFEIELLSVSAQGPAGLYPSGPSPAFSPTPQPTPPTPPTPSPSPAPAPAPASTGRGGLTPLPTATSPSPLTTALPTSSSAQQSSNAPRAFLVTHRTPGPMGLQMQPVQLTYVADGRQTVAFACLVTASSKISTIQPGDVIVGLNGGPPLVADRAAGATDGDGHVVSVATVLSKVVMTRSTHGPSPRQRLPHPPFLSPPMPTYLHTFRRALPRSRSSGAQRSTPAPRRRICPRKRSPRSLNDAHSHAKRDQSTPFDERQELISRKDPPNILHMTLPRL